MAAPADEQRVRLRALLQGSRNATAERHSVPHPLRVREAEVSFERVFDQITLARDEDRRCGRTVPCRRSRSARLQEPPMRSPGVAAQRCRGRLQLAPRTCLADYRFDLWAKHRAHYCLGDIWIARLDWGDHRSGRSDSYQRPRPQWPATARRHASTGAASALPVGRRAAPGSRDRCRRPRTGAGWPSLSRKRQRRKLAEAAVGLLLMGGCRSVRWHGRVPGRAQ